MLWSQRKRVKLPRRSDACAVQPEAPKDADVKDRIALRSQDFLPSRGSEDLAAALVLLQATFALSVSGRLPQTGQPTPA
jgi:hypothetical protein